MVDKCEASKLAETLFRGTRLRLMEARAQRSHFEKQWKTHLSKVPWEFSLESTDDFSHVLLAKEIRPMPAQLSLHFSIWLQQLRSALDNALYACAGTLDGSGTPPNSNMIEFPIVDTERKFKGTKTIKSAGLPEPIVPLLRKHQPYALQKRLPPLNPRSYRNQKLRLPEPHRFEPANNPHLSPLYWLNELARRDRHRVMHIGIGSIKTPDNMRLIGGADHTPTYRHPENQIFTGTSSVLKFITTSPLRYRKFKFSQKLELLPDIEDWIGATSLVSVFEGRDIVDVEMHIPLKKRMEEVEHTVARICQELSRLTHLSSMYFDPWTISISSTDGEEISPEQLTAMRQRRKANGL